MTKQTKVLIADDHAVVRAGIRYFLNDPSLMCVGEVEDGALLEQAIAETQPDVLILDLAMPNFADPAAFVRHIRAKVPQLQILVLSGYDDDETVYGLVTAGATGYLLKDDMPDSLSLAVRKVARGEGHYSQKVAHKLAELLRGNRPATKATVEPATELTQREMEVLRYVGRGLSNADIAKAMTLSQYTVRSHISRINAKLGLGSRAEMVRYAIQHGFTED